MSIELFAARHGETIANVERRLAGKDTDSPLTEKGIKQAKLLRDSLKEMKFDIVYCSPLKRAIDTVSIIFGNKYEICIDPRLAEIGLGVMDGMTYSESSQKYPDSGMLFFSNPSLYRTPLGGESLRDMIKRVSSFIDDIERLEGKTLFVQTHGYVLRVLYSCMLDRSILSIANSPQYSNCDVAHYTYDSEQWTIGKPPVQIPI